MDTRRLAGVPPPHRLALSAAEWAVLVDRRGPALPPGFSGGEVDPTKLREAARGLVGRGVLAGGDGDDPLDRDLVGPVAANLATLAGPQALTQFEVSVDGRGLRAAYAVRGPLGASLLTLAGGGVELSMFAAVTLGWELVRAVPPPQELAVPGGQIRRALDPANGGAALSGRLPLSALRRYGPLGDLAGAPGGPAEAARADAAAGADAAGLDTDQEALAAAVAERCVGVLRCLVTGPAGSGVAVGQVLWLATDEGWVGLQPEPTGSAGGVGSAGPAGPQEPVVALVPVAREDIGTWLAPYLAPLLEAVYGRP